MANNLRRHLAVSAILFFCGIALDAVAQDFEPWPRPGMAKRAWGPEQATGAPDTPRMGDFQTAWASLQPDAGMEWLEVTFERAVMIDEVRVRESCNPGAICRVTATLEDGQEFVVWQGEAAPKNPPAPDEGRAAAPPPADFAAKCNGDAIAKTITIYIDSARVPGWNEIDAVELVGKDGTRQWAVQAMASSTYADQIGHEGIGMRGEEPDPFAELAQRQVEVFLEGGKTIRAVFTRHSGNFIVLKSVDGRNTIIINVAKMVGIQTVEGEK